MQRLTETDFEILELVKEAQPDKVSKGKILASVGNSSQLTQTSIEKLERRNYLSQTQEYGFTKYFISENNKAMNPSFARCPICRTERRIFSDKQQIATCANPECRTPNGKKRIFWLRKRDSGNKLKGVETVNYA